MPTLRQLAFLAAISETGRYGEAARRLGVSQSAVSAQIDALETRLGVRLLERGRHGATLTPAGDEVVRKARQVLELVGEIEAVAAQRASNLGGLIRLGALATLGPYLLPYVTPRLHADYPDLRLFVREAPTVELEGLILDGGLDAALATAPEAATGLVSEILFTERLFIAMPVDDPLAGVDALGPSHLRGRDLLTLGDRYKLGRTTARLAEEAGAQIRFDYEGSSLDAIRQMVATGLGLALVTELYVRSEIEGRRDVAIARLHGPRWNRSIHLVWRSGARREDDYRALGGVIRDAAAERLIGPR
ncbi:MAG: hydrogen peroxide-inducible genes activator [Pseudomonadota bacterium]